MPEEIRATTACGGRICKRPLLPPVGVTQNSLDGEQVDYNEVAAYTEKCSGEKQKPNYETNIIFNKNEGSLTY